MAEMEDILGGEEEDMVNLPKEVLVVVEAVDIMVEGEMVFMDMVLVEVVEHMVMVEMENMEEGSLENLVEVEEALMDLVEMESA